MAYKLIAADLDRTLLRSDGTVSDFTNETIRACIDAGVGFTFATGRMYCSALPIARRLELELPLITYQGALLKTLNGDVMHALHLPDEIAGKLEEILRTSGMHYNIYSDEKLYFSTFGQKVMDYARHIGVEPLAAPKGLGDIQVTQYGVFDEPERIAELQQHIAEMFGEQVHTVTSGGRFLEICHPMAQKSYGLSQLAEHLGIHRDEIIAVGDNNNDLDMLQYAGLGVAVENAVQAAKDAANRLTASNDDDGVARLIQELILQK